MSVSICNIKKSITFNYDSIPFKQNKLGNYALLVLQRNGILGHKTIQHMGVYT